MKAVALLLVFLAVATVAQEPGYQVSPPSVLQPASGVGDLAHGETVMSLNGAPPAPPSDGPPADPQAVVGVAADGKQLRQVAVVVPIPCQCQYPPCSCTHVSHASLLEVEAKKDPLVVTPVTYGQPSGTLMVTNHALGDPANGVTILSPANLTAIAQQPAPNGSVGISVNGKPLYAANVVSNSQNCGCACACAQVVQACSCCNTFCTNLRFAEVRTTASNSANLRGHIKMNLHSLKAKLLQKKTAPLTADTSAQATAAQAAQAEQAQKALTGQIAQQSVNSGGASGLSTTNAAIAGDGGCGPDTVIAIKNTNIVQKINQQCDSSKR